MTQERILVRGADGRLYAVSNGACSELRGEPDVLVPAGASRAANAVATAAGDSESACCLIMP